MGWRIAKVNGERSLTNIAYASDNTRSIGVRQGTGPACPLGGYRTPILERIPKVLR